MPLKAFRLSARSCCQSASMARSSGSGSRSAALSHKAISLATFSKDSRSYMRVLLGLLEAGRGGRDVGVGRDGQAVVAERRGDAGELTALVTMRVRGHGAAEAVCPLGDGP